jgi:hypothetical protein
MLSGWLSPYGTQAGSARAGRPRRAPGRRARGALPLADLRRGRGRPRDLFRGLKTQLCVDHTSITPDLFACAILCSCSWT